jgi:hypothetical protein
VYSVLVEAMVLEATLLGEASVLVGATVYGAAVLGGRFREYG